MADRRGEGALPWSICSMLFGFLSRIVSRINEGNIKRPSEAKLDDRLLVGCPDTMNVIWRKHQK